MNIPRRILKQQIAAASALIVRMQTRLPDSAISETEDAQLVDALSRLEHTTEALARQTYAAAAPISPTSRSEP
jgi:hypothetical protein